MPKIPIYQSQEPTLRPNESVAPEIARTGQIIGQQFQKAAGVVSDVVAKVEAPELNKRRADLFNQTYQDIQDKIKSGNVNDPNFTQDLLNSTIVPAAQKLTDGWLSEKTQESARGYAEFMTEHLLRYSLEDVSRESADRGIAAITTQQNDSEKFVMLHPETLDTKLAEANTSIDSLQKVHGVSAAVSAALEKSRPEMLGKIADAGLEGIAANAATSGDPSKVQQALKLITDPTGSYYKFSTKEGLEKAIDSLNKTTQTLASTKDEIAAQALPDILDQIKNNGGIVTPAATGLMSGTYGTDKETAIKRAEYTRQIQDAEAYGKVSAGVRGLPEDDGWGLVKAIQDKIKGEQDPDKLGPERAQLEATIQTLQARAKEYQKNPGGYMTDPDNDPAVAAAFQNWQKQPTAENFAIYAQRTIADQKRLFGSHIPAPFLLTDPIREAAGQAVQNITSPEGAERSAIALGQLRQQVGEAYWGQVVQELQHEGHLTGDAGVAAAIVGQPESQALAENILYASAVSAGDRFNTHQISEAEARKLADTAFANLQGTISTNSPKGQEMLSTYETALAHVLQYTGVKDAATARVMADKMGQGKFQYPSGQPTLRVPANLDADRIVDGAKAVQADIGNLERHNLVVPPSFSGLGAKDQRLNYAAQIRATGQWYTNDDGSGAMLFDEDGHNVQEMVNGKPTYVELKWNDLGEAADKLPGRATFKAGATILDKAVKALGGQ